MAGHRHLMKQISTLLTTAAAAASRRHPQMGTEHIAALGSLITRDLHNLAGSHNFHSRASPAAPQATSLLGLGLHQSLQGPSSSRSFRTSAANLARTYYETLNVSSTASDTEIKKAYYKLAKQYHPDTNKDDPDAAKKFQEVQRAYDTLRDPQKRAAYDQLGHASYEAAEAGGGAPGAGPFGAGGAQVDTEDLFREFFGGGGGGFQGSIFEQMFGGRPRKGRNIQAAMTISFEDAMKGTKQTVDLASLGMSGLYGRKPVEITIPPGVDSGFQLRVAGQGAPGPQGLPPGDLLIQIMVVPSRKFRREGSNLFVEVGVNMADAALGTAIDVPTIHGQTEVKIKPGTQPGDKLRMRGYGVPTDALGIPGRRGDQFVVVKVTVPKHLTERQKALLEEFRGGKPVGEASVPPPEAESKKSSGEGEGGEGAEEGSGSNEEGTKKKKKKGWFFG